MDEDGREAVGDAGAMSLHHDRSTADAEFLGLRTGSVDGRFEFTVDPHLARFDQGLYGGAAVAVSLAAIERVTSRDAVWVTTQFVSMARLGAEIEVHVEVLAAGRRTSQVRITAQGDDGVVFAALGAAGVPKPDGMDGTFERCPTVASPATAPIGFPAAVHHLDVGWHTAADIRVPDVLDHPAAGPGRLCLWVRRRDGHAVTPAVAAYLADVVPLSIARACGVLGAGTSLDNSVRVGTAAETEWVLLDMRPHLAAGGYGHGSVHLWTEDGHLLATASQTAAMVELDFDPLTHTGGS